MWRYNYSSENKPICHFGIKGMKWGYNDGERNGKRVAREDEEKVEEAEEFQLFDTVRNITTFPGGKPETITIRKKGAISKLVDKGKKLVDSIGDLDVGDIVGKVDNTVSKTKNSIEKFLGKAFGRTHTITVSGDVVPHKENNVSKRLKDNK